MKITFVIPHDSLSGGIRVVAIYAERLQQRGHSVTVVSAPHPPASLKQRLKRLWPFSSRQVQPQNLTSSYFDTLAVRRHTLDRYRPLQDQDVPDADVIIATWWETAEWIASLSAAKGVKVYFVQHHEVFDYLPQERVEATYRLPFFHITIAQWLVDLLRDRYQSPAIALVPNGVDLDQFNCPVRTQASMPTIGFVYSATPWKGCDIAIQAYEYARQSIPNLQLVTFGTEAPNETLVLPPGTQHQVQPPQATLKTLYSQCDAWLFSSRVEGFGLPILEAMACRTPVIATPVGAAPELLASGGGILLNAVHPREMAIAIEKIYQLAPHQWLALSTQAYQIASKHTWSGATDLFEAALYRAIDRTD